MRSFVALSLTVWALIALLAAQPAPAVILSIIALILI